MLLWGSLCHQADVYIWDRPWTTSLCLSTGSLHLLCEDVMDRFLVKGALGGLLEKRGHKQTGGGPAELGESEESARKRPRRETPRNGVDLPAPSWQHIQAEGLDCDYTVLFGKAEADEIFRELEQEVEYFTGALARVQVFGKWHSVPRKQATYGDAGLTYTFSGLTLSPKSWIPVLERVRDRVSSVTGQTFNFVLVNREKRFMIKVYIYEPGELEDMFLASVGELSFKAGDLIGLDNKVKRLQARLPCKPRYKDGCDHIGEHRDDERELAPRSPIASVSFGACRDFLFRHKDSRGKTPCRRVEAVRLPLAHGSLLMMNHPTNTHWYHSLPVRKKVLAPRVNLTFRKILPTKK